MSRVVALAALFVSPCAAEPGSDTSLVNDPEYIQRLNAEPDATWVADAQEVFEGLTVAAMRGLLGTRLSHISGHLNSTLPDTFYDAILRDDVPAEFDSETQWPGLIHPIRDQQQCGSCWAFSASEVLSDRVAIAAGSPSPVLSAEDMVSCDTKDDGCQGGELNQAWNYLTHTGIVTDTCFPYTAGGGDAPRCVDKCVDSESFVRTRAANAYAINGPSNMQKDILTYGPIQVGFKVYLSFQLYRSGVYHKRIWEKLPMGGHAVKIVGWGVDHNIFGKEVHFWKVANSWGPTWGDKGFFKIRRGSDECGIESMGPPYAGTAPTALDLIMV